MSDRYQKTNELFEKVSRVIPYAAQTFSKSHYQYVQGAAPLFVTHAKGAKIWDVDGNQYTDFINGLLAVILGYQYEAVDDAIRAQLEKGITFTLSSTLEYELAQKLIELIPCAEMVRFGKNGSDATTGAVRLARAVTGRDHVIVGGYHGWHDWYIGSTTRHMGVPESTRALTHKFTYNDIDSLQKVLEEHKGEVACVILEAINYKTPKPGFLESVKELTHKHGALLIFDEVITGFRYGLGGAQGRTGVIPDLATFGKSMANGMPISALVGKEEYMKVVDDIFYSFTAGGEALSLAAALATIKEMEEKNVPEYLWKIGEDLIAKTNNTIAKHGLEDVLSVTGMPCWSLMLVEDTEAADGLLLRSYMQQEILEAGYLWYGQHNVSFSHTQEDIDGLVAQYDSVFAKVKDAIEKGDVRERMKGEPMTNIFKVR